MRFVVFMYLVAMLAVIAGMRDGIIFDYGTYASVFDTLPQAITTPADFITFYFSEFKIEPLSLVISYLGSLLGGERFVFFAFASLTLGILGYAALRLTPYPFIALLFYFSNYFFFLPMAQIRSGLAYSLLAVAALLLINQKTLKSFFFFAAATAAHFSALVFVVVYFWRRYESVCRHSLLILLSSAAIGFSGVGEYVVLTAYHLLGEPPFLYSYILGHRSEGAPLLNLGLYQSLVVLLIAALFYRKPPPHDTTLHFLIAIVTIGCALRLALFDFHQLGARLATAFLFFDAFLLGYLLTAFRPRLYAAIIVTAACGLIFLYNYHYLQLSEGYKTWLLTSL
nr:MULTISPECIES: EpsG family protein [unclassified Halorhodospira]